MDSLRVRISLVLTAAVLSLAGCGGSGPDQQTGYFSLSVSDHPMHDVGKVCIAFSEIELKPRHGPAILANKLIGAAATANVNLLEYQGMNAAPLIMDYEVPAGEYLWVRLGVNAMLGGEGGMTDATPELPDCQGDESYLVSDGVVHNIYIPSGEESGLKLHGSIIVPHGGAADFTAEVDLMKSIAFPDGLAPDVAFRPTIRIVNNAEVGAVTGQVANTLVLDTPNCAPSVYLFEDDMMDAALDASNALTSAIVEEQPDGLGGTEYRYTIGFLLAGMYELAFSCDDGATLQPENGKPVTINAGDEPATIDFP